MMGERGCDPEMIRRCSEAISTIMKHKSAWPFNEPVNAAALGLVDYHQIITRPMDMGTIRNRIDSRHYSSADDFCLDMRLVFDNAMTYNPPGTDVHIMASSVLDQFERKWIKMIENMHKPPAKPRTDVVYKDDLPGYDDLDLPLPGQNHSTRPSRHVCNSAETLTLTLVRANYRDALW